jgi:dTDP-4-dehydrorhamnose reductase
LGRALTRRLERRAIPLCRADLDLSKTSDISPVVRGHGPSVVINCAAYTAVDKAESESDLCFAVNAAAVERLADVCQQLGILLVQVSTDYVFGAASADGVARRPWRETDPPDPQGVYAQSKLAGETAASRCPRHLVVRTCGLYGGGPGHVSFVEKMLSLSQTKKKLRIVSDQHCTPSLVDDVADAITSLLQADARGIFHVVNGGETTWYDFAAEVFRLARVQMELEPISSQEFAAPAPRPKYSVLDGAKLAAVRGKPMRPWREALADYLHRLRPLRMA